MFRLYNSVAMQPNRLLPITVRTFSRNTAESSMAGRFKPKNILNFDKKGGYMIYNSSFARIARARMFNHPSKDAFALTIVSSIGMSFGLGMAFI